MTGPCVIVVLAPVEVDGVDTECDEVTGVIGNPPFPDEAAANAWLDEHLSHEKGMWRIWPLSAQAEITQRAYGGRS